MRLKECNEKMSLCHESCRTATATSKETIYLCGMADLRKINQTYTMIIRPLIYVAIFIFSAIVYFGQMESLYPGGNRNTSLFFMAITGTMLFMHFWLQRRIKANQKKETKD